MTPADIAALTPDQLRRRIADRLGWHDFQLSRLSSLLWAYEGDDTTKSPVPDWHEDANAALALVDGIEDATLTLCGPGWPHKWEASIPRPRRFEYLEYVTAYADTPALAICRAWLAYMDAEGNDDGT